VLLQFRWPDPSRRDPKATTTRAVNNLTVRITVLFAYVFSGNYLSLRHVADALVTSSSSKSIGRQRMAAPETRSSREVEMTSLRNAPAAGFHRVWHALKSRLTSMMMMMLLVVTTLLAGIEEHRMKKLFTSNWTLTAHQP